MEARPLYARFYKCDLHMHSPFDSYWRDDTTRLKTSDPDTRKTAIAQQYLHACHMAGLEAIAITDHNFAPGPEHSFVNWLDKENETVAQELGRAPLVIFPGFEVQVDVGKGYHVLCVFPPDTPLKEVDDRLTALGLPTTKRYDSNGQGQPRPTPKHLGEVLKTIQDSERYKGIVIAPHPFEHGILDDEQMEMWLQQEEFCNPLLLAIELHKPLEKLSNNLQKLLRNGSDCQPEWRRPRPIAWLMSSDSFRIEPDPAQPGNVIGYRHTWIKMSRPSIESLRQAFLDHESRLQFGLETPETRYTYPKIRRVSVQGARFLRGPDEFVWSPNLNCLIGSRGTGKSTLLDYMRVALDRMREGDIPPSLLNEVEGRVRDTLTAETRIEVEIEKAGVEYRVVYMGEGNGQRQVFQVQSDLPDPALDVRTLFPCRFLSQREIDHSIERRERAALRRFLDDFIRQETTDLEYRERELRGNISQVEAALTAKSESQKRRAELESERRDLENQLERQKRLSELLPYWQGIETERDFFTRLFAEQSELLECWRNNLTQLELRPTLLTDDLRSSPNAALIAQAAQMADEAVQQLRRAIEKDLEKFAQAVQTENAPLQKLYQNDWLPQCEQARQCFEAAQIEAQQQGANLESITVIPQRLLSIQTELQALEREKKEIKQLEEERSRLLKDLHQVWREQTQVRLNKAKELMDKLRPDPAKKPYVEIRVKHQADLDEMTKLLAAKIPDKRRLNDEDIRALLEHLDDQSFAAPDQPTLIELFVEEARHCRDSVFLRDALQDRRREAFCEIFTESVLRQIEVERVPDYVMYHIYRQDGTLAGPIDRVSAGQQGTAILNLFLAAGNEPLIVDTPEEGLDNEGVYAELVPLFRREKEKRQILIVTHNANLPVNADAEGIFALEAAGYVLDDKLSSILQNAGVNVNEDQRQHLAGLIRWSDWEKRVEKYLTKTLHVNQQVAQVILSQMGEERQAEGRIKLIAEDGVHSMAVGALDAPAVKEAVQNIMEGSEEAFRRRREMYGF